ncbi:DegV family protein [Bacillus manliponensis]|uniref:DegV family protein n=1 Tax=Bacillus manliponensis TaxID=574376 RepID=UPI0035120156
MSIQIITDSAADLPKELMQMYDIEVIPIRVYDEEETEYLDGVTLQAEQLLRNMKEGKRYKTSLPPLHLIEDTFVKYAKEEVSCIYLAVSAELSGTYQSSVLVQNEVREIYPKSDIEIIDTKCASLGQGILVLEAAKMAKEGKTKQEVMERVTFLSNHMEHIFTVADLQYLVRGGRLSKTAGFVGGLLNIKPVLHVKDGTVMPFEKVRGEKKLLNRLIQIIGERGNSLRNQVIGIGHGDDLENAEKIKKAITETYGCEVFLVNTIGAAVGAHVGPGVLGVFFANRTE